jgi:hypothetical protein
MESRRHGFAAPTGTASESSGLTFDPINKEKKWDGTEAVHPNKNPAFQDFFTVISLFVSSASLW